MSTVKGSLLSLILTRSSYRDHKEIMEMAEAPTSREFGRLQSPLSR